MIDAIVDSYFPPVEEIGDSIDGIEDEMIGQPQKQQVRRLHQLRRSVIMLKGSLFPVRDAIAGLIRAEAPFVRAETKVYFNDTLDHSISLIEMVETQRDMLTGLIDMHLSLSQARTNEIISLPDHRLGDLHPVDLHRRHLGHEFRSRRPRRGTCRSSRPITAIRLALGFMALVAVWLVAYFRWKKWL